MDRKIPLEEHLREASAIGDINAVQQLLKLGVDVNARHAVNGWTPLHWACKRNCVEVVALLIQNGADKNAVSNNGDTPASVSKNSSIFKLLGVTTDTSKDYAFEQETPNFIPNYIKNAPLNYKIDLDQYKSEKSNFAPPINSINFYENELVLKIRIADAADLDFIEVEIPRHSLTYQTLIRICCEELGIIEYEIVKLRKLPNTKLRKDKDIQRLKDFQEIEVVTNRISINKQAQHSNGTAVPVTPSNNYQSISKKDQTILY